MKHTSIERPPPQQDARSEGRSARSYLKSYGLLLQVFRQAVESESTTLLESDCSLHISRLIDPLAFEAGHTDVVKSIESQNLFSGGSTKQIQIKTTILDSGSRGWFIFPDSNTVLLTSVGVGNEAGLINGPTMKFPPENWKKARVLLYEWQSEFDELYKNPLQRDHFEFHTIPADDALFEFGFTFTRSK